MEMSLDYAAPEKALRNYLSVFYEFRTDAPVFEDDERADFAQIRFLLHGKGAYRFADGHECDAPQIAIVGPTTGNTRIKVEGPIHAFGSGILPAGWAAIMGTDASALVNRVIDARDIFGARLETTLDELRKATSLEERVAIASQTIHTLIRHMDEKPLLFMRAVENWLSSSPSADPSELAERLGLSTRQVERQCKRFYGIPPKMLARKYRALRAAIHLTQEGADIDSAMGEHFCDQSHLIREVKAFTGVTPKRFQDDLPTLAKLTLKRAELAGEVKPFIYET